MKEIIDFLSGFNVQTILSMIAVLMCFAKWIKSEIGAEIKVIREEIKTIQDQIKSNREEFILTRDSQAARSDRLYEMFIELLKEKK